jgi:hypothetical protein
MNRNDQKRIWKPERSDLGVALIELFKQQGSDNVPMSGALL